MDTQKTRRFIDSLWDREIVPAITDYIRIPNQSPMFDPDWAEHGYMDQAVELATAWVRRREVANSRMEVLRLEGRTPLILLEIDGTLPGTVLLYGHLDKQPPFEGWRTEEGLGPWTPVLKDGKLYGRGGADDGYAIFASVAAVQALHDQGIEHPRLVVVIECSEESGSPDLPAYMAAYADRIGTPDLVVCLDSGCGDYDRLWSTTSLRGNVVGELTVEVLTEGVHSGDASGVVASSFRVLRLLLDRLEDAETGGLLSDALYQPIPDQRIAQAERAATVMGTAIYDKFPLVDGMQPMHDNLTQLILNRTWRPTLSYTGIDGLPTIAQGGNVLRPQTAIKLSFRIPPTLDAAVAEAEIKRILESNPPYGARVRFESREPANGWEAPATATWLEAATDAASETYFGSPACAMGEGGSIPFMAMLGDQYPQAQFLITGVLGPHSNAHGPNEFLHIQCAKNVTCCVADILTKVPR